MILYSDNDYITGLKNGDETIIYSFFYTLCAYTLHDIRLSLMQGCVSYNELVNELYLYLSVDNWRKLDTFEGKNGCSLKSWMIKLAWRFFMQRRANLMCHVYQHDWQVEENRMIDTLPIEIAMDVESTFIRMPNKRYVQVLRWMLSEGYSAEEVSKLLKTPVSNVYNIKRRAIVQFLEFFNR